QRVPRLADEPPPLDHLDRRGGAGLGGRRDDRDRHARALARCRRLVGGAAGAASAERRGAGLAGPAPPARAPGVSAAGGRVPSVRHAPKQAGRDAVAQDLRSYPDSIKRTRAADFQIVSRPVDPSYEITGLVAKLE